MSRSVAGSSTSGGVSQAYANSEAGTDAEQGKRSKLNDIGDKVMKLVTTDLENRFGDVGELVEEYPCALESGILRQGKMYVTNRFVCFYCSHFGQEKKIRIPYKQIIGMAKENTAKVFPNAISIKTKQTEYMFRSFLHRDECHSLLTAMWKNFKDFEKTGGRKTEPAQSFELPEQAEPVVKMVYENYKIQLIDVFIIPAVNGKKGHSFILEVTQARDKILSTVPVEFSVLKELNDALVELNPSYEQYAKFPAINAGGFSGLTKITQAQIDERATQLCQWIAGVMTSVAPASLIMNPTPPPYVISNPRVDNAAAYPLMPGDIKLDLAELLQIPVSVLDPITVQLPQSKSKNDLGLLHIKTALDALAVTDPAQVDIQVKQNHDAKDDLPKVSVAVSRVEKSDKIAMNKKVFYQTEFLIGNHIYLFVKEFSAYRKLYEDLRMRGIGYNVLQDAAVDEIPPSAPLEPIESSVDSSDSDSDDSGFEGSNKKRNRKPKVKEMFSNLLTSKPTRHGSFSEIELDIQLSVPFPRKFHTKLTSKDLAERCTALDSWMRSLMMNYHKLSLETKDIVNNFLGFFDNLEADQLMNLINVIDRITHAGAVSENSHLAPVALIGDSSHSDMTSLTAGTREGGGSILKTAAAAIGGLVRPSQPTRETFQEKSDGSSSGGDDSSSVPAQPLVEALAQETDNSQTSSTTNTLVHEKSAIIPATQPANVPVAVSTLQVDANPAVIAPLNENGAGKSSGNAVVVNSAVNLETKMNPQVDKKGTENAPNKANVVVVDQEDNEVAPLPNPKGCCIIS